jgi:phosphopentomutase
MGCVLEERFPVFPEGFPPEIVEPFLARTGLPGILGNEPASGTEIVERLGVEHVATGKPIVYTSADSVFQVAAHERHFGLERLYDVCRVAREILDPYGVGRVIARPFVGEPGAFTRTYNRRDFSLLPPSDNTLTRLGAAGVPVIGVGKIEDIFAGVGVGESIHTEGNRDGMRRLTERAGSLEGGFVFVNLVDFDMLYGHRRDAAGYRRALEEFDADYTVFERALVPGDVVMMTADHGNDPTHAAGTDHTREYVPLLVHAPGSVHARGAVLRSGVDLGTRTSFADLGASVEELFGLEPAGPGRSFVPELTAS